MVTDTPVVTKFSKRKKPRKKIPLHVACKTRNYQDVKCLLDKDVTKVDEVDRTKKTALYHTIAAGDYDILTLLVEKGASVNAIDKKGTSALQFVCSQKKNDVDYKDIVRFLLQCGIETKNTERNQ